jgi:hypothetical protein
MVAQIDWSRYLRTPQGYMPSSFNISLQGSQLKSGGYDAGVSSGFSGGSRFSGPSFDPNSARFNSQAFMQDLGLPLNTPSGDYLGGSSSFGDLSKNIERSYGVSMADFMNMDPGKRETLFRAKKDKYQGDLFDPVTGMPTRPPKTKEEAIEFQWRADEYARKKGEQNLANSISSLRYALGMTKKSSPFSLATMMSPTLGNMASTYANTNYQPADYSAFFRPDVLQSSPSAAYGGYVNPPGGL